MNNIQSNEPKLLRCATGVAESGSVPLLAATEDKANLVSPLVGSRQTDLSAIMSCERRWYWEIGTDQTDVHYRSTVLDPISDLEIGNYLWKYRLDQQKGQ